MTKVGILKGLKVIKANCCSVQMVWPFINVLQSYTESYRGMECCLRFGPGAGAGQLAVV